MYRVDTDPEALDQIAALPVRQLIFGPEGNGLVTYLILEDQQRVDVLKVQWAG